MKVLVIGLLLLFNSIGLFAQNPGAGSIKGVIVEKSDKPLEFVNVMVKNMKDSSMVQGAVTDKHGLFVVEGLPFGEYKIGYSYIGFGETESGVIVLDSKHHRVDMGKLFISESGIILNEVEVIGQKSTFVNSIDRKTFNVGQDLMSKTGSVSDLLQSVPSVLVDIDGNVTLRGSDNVMILINGKPSALMGANRAAVLQQMPANSIEKIEVITNPSAKYKPDGTSGIINIVLKKNENLGLNGSISLNAGNQKRYNGNIITNYNPGKLNVFGSYSIRQDDRFRIIEDFRKRTNLNNGPIAYFHQNSQDHSRPLSHILRTGFDYKVNDHNEVGVAGSYNYRSLTREAIDINTYENADFLVNKKYNRILTNPEYEKDMELTAYIHHAFAKEDHELNVDFTASRSQERDDNRFNNIYHIPVSPSTFDNTLIKEGEDESQLSFEYLNPISDDIQFESGYVLESRKADLDFFGESFDPNTNLWSKDIEKINHFVYTENIHVLYATYAQESGKFGFLGGIRAEQAFINSNQLTTETIKRNQYFRFYPSLHIAYKISDLHELQLNYSHRIHRPDGDDLNPFPEYQDPYNLRIGNPLLKPADIHSIEMGYQLKKDKMSFLSTLYYRYTYNGISEITRYVNDSVKLTVKENLSKSSSAGLELVCSKSIGNFANIHLGSNIFYNTIDASNLGYSKNKSIVAWSANLTAGFNISKSQVLQLTTNYSASRLTPQGKQLPSYILNIGLKQEVMKKKGALIVTISDLFNSLRNNTIVDTPELYETINRKRSARIVYLGFTYSFGTSKKKENSLKFDEQL